MNWNDRMVTVAVLCVILWLLAMVAGYDLGGWVWALLPVAAVLFLVAACRNELDEVQ